jgi:hypothetical protein
MGIDIRESAHHAAGPYLQVPLLVLPFGCTGYFVHSTVHVTFLEHSQSRLYPWSRCGTETERLRHTSEGVASSCGSLDTGSDYIIMLGASKLRRQT